MLEQHIQTFSKVVKVREKENSLIRQDSKVRKIQKILLDTLAQIALQKLMRMGYILQKNLDT